MKALTQRNFLKRSKTLLPDFTELFGLILIQACFMVPASYAVGPSHYSTRQYDSNASGQGDAEAQEPLSPVSNQGHFDSNSSTSTITHHIDDESEAYHQQADKARDTSNQAQFGSYFEPEDRIKISKEAAAENKKAAKLATNPVTKKQHRREAAFHNGEVQSLKTKK